MKQKLYRRPIGYGGLSNGIALMTLQEFFSRLELIHRLITNRFQRCIHMLQPGSITKTSSEEMLILMLQAMNKDLVIWSNCLIENHSVDILLLDYQIGVEVNGGIHDVEFKMSQDTYKQESLYEKFKIHTMSVYNHDITRLANLVTTQIRTREIKKGDRKRIKKLYRDILIKTISYWIDEKDISKLLLLDMNKPVNMRSTFKSKILLPFQENNIQTEAA